MTAQPVVTLQGRSSAEYGCPDCEWCVTVSSSDRVTRKTLDADLGGSYDEHRAAAHPGPLGYICPECNHVGEPKDHNLHAEPSAGEGS